MNEREDFKGDDDYAAMLEAFRSRFNPETKLKLEWGGDMIDFHALPYRGRAARLPTENVAFGKLEACIAGHPRFWAATRDFLADPRHALDVTIGNHDFELAWPAVQGRIRQELGVGPDRLRFVTTVIEGDTAKLHGDLFDPFNAIPPQEDWFVADKRRGKDIVLLNLPYSSILNGTVGQAMKARQPWVGRMQDYNALWAWSLARDWYFAIKTFLLLVYYLIYNRFISRPDVRSKAKVWKTLPLLFGASGDHVVEEELRRFIALHPDVRVIEAGHTHHAGVERLQAGGHEILLYNTGTGVELVRLRKPEYKRMFTSFPKFEEFFRRIVSYWIQRPILAIGLIFIHMVAAIAPFLIDLWAGETPGWISWTILGLVIFSLIMRQSYALHVEERYTEYTPIMEMTNADGRRERSLLRFLPASRTFEPYAAS